MGPPLFFVIFRSDLPTAVLPGNTVALYADGRKRLRIAVDSAVDLELFQQDLDNLHGWSSLNCEELNVKKCKIHTITIKKQLCVSSFCLNRNILKEVGKF